jgi:hypothetical protein
MKYIFSILSITAVTLFGINLNHVAEIQKPLPSETPKVSVPTNYSLDKCPATGQPSYSASIDIEAIYKHCPTCNHGVFLEHDDGITKCTFCGIKEEHKH